jgi:hypothetical protein
LAFNISFIPREENASADFLSVTASLLEVLTPPMVRSDVEIKYRPSVPDNVKHWKVFEDDLEIKKFLQYVDDFSALHIDEDPDMEDDPHPGVFLNKIANH